MTKTCSELLSGQNASFTGNAQRAVSGLASSSNKVNPGDAFFCIVGLVSDGHAFAQDAVDRGASLVVAQRELQLENAEDVTVAVVEDTRVAAAAAAAVFYDHPSASFKLVGITGTNGKTTTTFLVDHLVQSAGGLCGIIGTTGNRVGMSFEHADHTTPDSMDLQHLFARMREAQCTAVAMEVSSHALDLKRTWGTTFAVTAFTNLTQDHLDYHKTFEAYYQAKAKLFGPDYPARRVVCIDDEWGTRLAGECAGRGDEVITTGFAEQADIHPVSVEYFDDRTQVQLSVQGAILSFAYPLVGRFNVSNMMTAFGIGLSLGLQPWAIAEALASAPGVPGRLERISDDSVPGVSVFVDYAHTPDAVEKVIASVRALNPARLLVVFGCGGDRDARKRPLMGRAALAGDFAIVTSDNPRTEDPDAIIADILTGMEGAQGSYVVEPDRAKAIHQAIDLAQPGDAILVAGKGHEDYQILGTETIHFDDREVVREALARKGSAQ
ncbi:MAG: UDP-N-acetylmuramoyl-L-alanyl-D-glutamate--2,6-diaminopimelate ligase [Coriobacteriia bacterium]|nr:UDP-N-acetylmuramoyl-L-alanyl-D-glutamate--2,6-diaminopimelate ligase [Coriobacteriia bacterium]